jgi:ligand-binding sensor domain-containing protein/signal transduction histidine kinase
MEKPITIQTLIRQSLFVAILSLLFSCTQNHPKQSDSVEKKSPLKPPVTITGKAPIVTLLDTCPPPRTIIIPRKKEDSFVLKINNSKTLIVPPEKKPADFMVLMNHYNIEHGLGTGAVESGCIDKKGNLWFATNGGGISRYDGKSFTNYTTTMGLVSNWVTDVLEDKDGNIWIATGGAMGGGVSKYNGKFFTYYKIKQGLGNNWVNSILQDKSGNLWLATQGGVYRYDGKTFKSYTTTDGLVNNWVTSIHEDKSGNLWFGTAQGVSRFDGKSFKSYTSPERLELMYVSSIAEDKNGNLWFGTGGGICRLDQNGSFKNYTRPVELTNKYISSVHQDKQGNLWFGTFGEGVFRLKEDGSITNFDSNRGLTNNNVSSILEDNNGNLWFCTQDGISRFDQSGKFFVGYTKAQGLASNGVTSFCEDKRGKLWFGTAGGGVSCLDRDGKTFTNYTTAQGLPDNGVRSIAEDKMGNLWFGTENGICQLDHDRKVFKVYTTLQGLPENSTRWIKEDKMGNLWVCTRRSGVFRLDQKRSSITSYTTEQGLVGNSVRDIIEDRSGNLWFTAVGGGISRFDQDSSYFTNYSTDQGMAHNNAWAMLEDKNGNLWIGTEAGVSRFDGTSFTNYTSADGLLTDAIDDLELDTEGVMWFGSKGFTALKGFAQDEKQNPLHGSELKPSNELSNAELKDGGFKPVFEIYSNKTGYPGKAINMMGVSQDGTIWSGTGGFVGDKLISFDFGGAHKNPNPLAVFIQTLKINNEIVSWYDLQLPDISQDSKKVESADSITTAPNIAEEGIALGKLLTEEQRATMQGKFNDVEFDSITRFYPLPVNLVLPYHHNNLTFDFVAIEPARPYLVRYQYMLEGYDNEWNPVTDQTSAAFGNMPEGNYTFKLKAQSPDGVWSEPVLYSFKVLPPWQRTWWAYSFYALLFITALWSFIRWRVKTLKKEKVVLEEKVAERTSELQQEKEKVENTLIDLKSTQAQLIQSEKMASLGELTVGIAHEIQNPLNFVNNFSELSNELLDEMNEGLNKGDIEEAKAIASDVKNNLEKINHHGKRADAIVKGMLQHSNSRSGAKEPTDINALADEYIKLSYHGFRAKDKSFNVKLNTDYDQTIGPMTITPQDIGRVILNLVNNAFYAVSAKASLTANAYEPTVSVSTKKIGDTVEVHVVDNGNGISPKILDKIFQPFFTTKPTGQGTGLGLSLAYDIVKAHGGELKVETLPRGTNGQESEGTEFIIYLPLK